MRYILPALVVLVFAVLHAIVGGGDGTRPAYVLPGFLLLGLAGLLSVFSLRKPPARANAACAVSFLIAAAYFFARVFTSPVAWLAWFDFFALLAAVLIYFITAIFTPGVGQRLSIIIGLLVLALAQSGLAVYQFVRDAGFNPLVSNTAGTAGLRASGLFISPNHLAGFLEVMLILGTSLCVWGGFRAVGKFIIGYLTLSCLGGLVLTGSRGGYLSAGAGLAVFALLSIWTVRFNLSQASARWFVGAAVALALIGGSIAFVVNRNSAIQARTNTVFTSEDIRLSLWEGAWKQFQLAPVLGTGSRTYAYYGRTFRPRHIQIDPAFAHNDWLQTLAEYGIAGVAAVLGFVIVHMRHALRRWLSMVERFTFMLLSTEERNALALQLGTMGAVVACLVHAVLDFNQHIPANMLLTAWLFGMLATARPSAGKVQSAVTARLVGAIPALAGVAMLVLGGRQLPGEIFVENARASFAAGQPGPAIEQAGLALERGARNPELHYLLGEAQRVLGERLRSKAAKLGALEDAYDAYAEAIAIHPNEVRYLVRAAWALDRLGRFDEAEALFVRARELDPDSSMVWAFSALHWKLQGRLAKARADFEHGYKVGGGHVHVFLAETGEKLELKDLDEAATQ